MQKYQHGGMIYDAKGAAGDWTDFSANINPLGVPSSVRQTIIENLDGIRNYPDPSATELKAAISRRYNVSTENLVLLNGAAEFFYLYFNVTSPRRVIIPVPSFSEYERAARAAGCEVEYICTRSEDNFALDVDNVNASGACIMLGRPNNPTGTMISLTAIKKLAEVASVVVDESFIDFLATESARGLVSENVSVVQSLTKIFAIPGLRLGFAVVNKNLAARLDAAKDVWNVNFLAQKAGVAALSDDDFIVKTRQWLATEQQYFIERLEEIGVKYFNPTANFVLLKFQSPDVAEFILAELRRERILLRSCANFIGLDGSYLRSAIRSRAENIRLLDALSRAV